MKMTSAVMILTLLLIAGASSAYAENPGMQTPNDASGTPSAVIPDGNYEFEPVLEGAEVIHEFKVLNTGTAPLEIERIKTGCGCTTADFTRSIPPGGQGHIVIKANTRGYGGTRFERPMTVFTNDPEKPTLKLMIGGHVDKFAEIVPATAVLKGKADETIETRITVHVEANHPFEVIDVHTDKTLEGKIEYNLITLGNGYVLRIKNIQQAPGHYFGRIVLKTDSPDKPEIAIPVTGKIS